MVEKHARDSRALRVSLEGRVAPLRALGMLEQLLSEDPRVLVETDMGLPPDGLRLDVDLVNRGAALELWSPHDLPDRELPRPSFVPTRLGF